MAIPHHARRWSWRAVAVPAGGLLSLVFPEAGLWWLAFVGLVPTLLLVGGADGGGDAVWRSWAAGTGFFVGLHHWMVPTLGVFIVPAALAMGATWIPLGVATWLLLGRSGGGGRALAAVAVVPSVWLLLEVARSWHPLGGSWGHLGVSQWRTGPILALAALGGVWLLSLLAVAVNTGIAVALRPGSSPTVRAVAIALPAALLLAGVAWGWGRPDPAVADTLRVAGVQPGVVDDREQRLAANETLTATIDGDAVDLVLWGQSSVGFDPATDEDVADRLEEVARRVGVDVLVNVDARRDDGAIAKSAVLVRPGRGLDDTYEKQRLVPFGEYIPLRPVLGWLATVTAAADEDRSPGGDVTLIEAGGVDVGPVISYESTFPDMRRTLARMGAELTIVQGASTTFQGTWAQPQQAAYEAVRAVESGRPAVLASVSGTSAAFDGRGRRLAWVPSEEVGVWFADVPLTQERTPFVRWGDWVPALAAVIVTGALARGAWVRWGAHR